MIMVKSFSLSKYLLSRHKTIKTSPNSLLMPLTRGNLKARMMMKNQMMSKRSVEVRSIELTTLFKACSKIRFQLRSQLSVRMKMMFRGLPPFAWSNLKSAACTNAPTHGSSKKNIVLFMNQGIKAILPAMVRCFNCSSFFTSFSFANFFKSALKSRFWVYWQIHQSLPQ